MRHAQGYARFSPGLGAAGAAVIGEHTLASNPLGIEPGHRPQQETDGRSLLLIRQHLDLDKASAIVDGHMGFLKARATAGSQTPITSDPVPDALKEGPLLLRRRSLRLGVDVDHVAGLAHL